MKRLIFIIWMLTASVGWATNYSTVTIGDSTWFNYTHDIGIDSAQLILHRGGGTTGDTLSLMPIVGSNHKMVEWENIFNHVDSAGTYQVWIESYNDDAIIDTVLGACQVELAHIGINLDDVIGTLDNDELADDIHFDSLSLRSFVISNNNTYPAFYVENTGGGYAAYFKTTAGTGKAGLKLEGAGTASYGLELAGTSRSLAGTFISANFDDDFITNAKIATNAFGNDELADDLTFDSLHTRTFVINNTSGTGYGLYIGSSVDNKAALMVDGTGTTTDGAKFSGTGLDFNVTLNFADVVGQVDSNEFADDYWDAVGNKAASGADSTAVFGAIVEAFNDSALVDTGWVAQDPEAWTSGDSTAHQGVGAGVGFNVCSLWVYDTGNTVMVSDIMVQAENASGANQGRDRTNPTGISILNLNDGDYNLRIPMNSGYIQTTNPQPFTVSGATNDTIEVTLFTPTAPAGDLCTVYNWIVDGNDNPIANANVSAEIPMEFWPVTYGGKAISARHSVRTDSTGKYELPIFPSTIILTAQGDSASYWMIDARHRGQEIFKHKVTVPDSTTFLMVPDAD